jgi:hypothetical protein
MRAEVAPKIGRSQRVTQNDLSRGQIRIPITGPTKAMLPKKPSRLVIVLKGRRIESRYDPRMGPDRQRSGVLGVDRSILSEAVSVGEVLPIVTSSRGVVYVGDRGSKLRIAEWVNRRAAALNQTLLDSSSTLRDFCTGSLRWRSPLLEKDFHEYSDDLWRALRLPTPDPVRDGFWPRGLPHWDGVATVPGPHGNRGLLLVEAKSHTNELKAECEASPSSRRRIVEALATAQQYVGVPRGVDWTAPYYQYANRLAFLYYLRARRNIPTWLCFIYFTGDDFEVGGVMQPCPAEKADWKPLLDDVQRTLALPNCHPLSHFTVELFLPATSQPSS